MRISDWSSDVCSSDLFPYGGMENPRLTFATPTVIVGDKSLVSLVAHELAHSWSGNLVTFSTSRDAWLNEGLTSYVANRIVEALYGKPQAAMEAVIARAELKDASTDANTPLPRLALTPRDVDYPPTPPPPPAPPQPPGVPQFQNDH